MKLRSAAAGPILCILSAGPAADVAAETGERRAMLDGGSLALEKVGRYHCHDLDSPVITCFRTSAELEAAVKGWMDRLGPDRGAAAVSYVRIWEHAEREGASIYLSADYANLGTIGWNDRITSLRSVNGGAGTFYHDEQMHGTPYGFCCNEIVDNVGGAHNDRFSSVEGG
jgi:hypothetical protein